MTPSFSEFHAHIYVDVESQEHAADLYQRIVNELQGINRGRFHTKCVGPHPTWMFTMDYEKGMFQEVTLWLMTHLNGLSALIHPLSGDDLDDHTRYAMWFGRQLELNLTKL